MDLSYIYNYITLITSIGIDGAALVNSVKVNVKLYKCINVNYVNYVNILNVNYINVNVIL